MELVWQTNTKLPNFPKLDSDTKTDVLIIGGGIVGMCSSDRNIRTA